MQSILAAKDRAEAHFQLEFTRGDSCAKDVGPPPFPVLAVVAEPKSDSSVYEEMVALTKAEAGDDVRELKFRLAEFPALKKKRWRIPPQHFFAARPCS